MFQEMSNMYLENMSVYIPHVFPNFTKDYIADVFERHNIGIVDHVDLVAKEDREGKPYNAAYVHFLHWCSGPEAVEMYYRIRNSNEEARIVHDSPWYWILLENRGKKYDPTARRPCIELERRPTAEPRIEFVDVEAQQQDPQLYNSRYLTDEESDELDAAIKFFQDEADELELQNEIALEDENRYLHEQNAKMAKEIADQKVYTADLHDVYQQLLSANWELKAQIAELQEKNGMLENDSLRSMRRSSSI
jgi:hypothetical protein